MTSPGPALVPGALKTLASAGVHLAGLAALAILVTPRLLPPPQTAAYVVVWQAASAPSAPQAGQAANVAPTLPAVADHAGPAVAAPGQPAAAPVAAPPRDRSVPRRPPASRARPSRAELPAPSRARVAPVAAAASGRPEADVPRGGGVPAAQGAAPADTAWLAAFSAQVQAAVQKAAGYPMLARRSHVQGRVEVGFDYQQGKAANPAVLVSSQAPALDRAALLAVASAAYPEAPAALGGGTVRLMVWVDFRMSPEG